MVALDVTVFNGLRDTRPRPLPGIPWERLSELLSTHEEREARDGKLWSPARYREGAPRGNGGVEALSCLVFDVDHDEPEWELLEGVEYTTHTTAKHHAEHPECKRCSEHDVSVEQKVRDACPNCAPPPDCQHWRIVIQLAEPVAAEDWDSFWRVARDVRCPMLMRAQRTRRGSSSCRHLGLGTRAKLSASRGVHSTRSH